MLKQTLSLKLLSILRHKWKDEERVVFENEEEAIIAQNIIEEVSG